MSYLRKISSLKDLATSQLAIHLCQDDSFKAVAMCLEKPLTDFDFWNSSHFKDVDEWDAAVDKQCQRLTEGLPHSLKHGVHVLMTRIALEYSSYSKRMELLFQISRYFLMAILTLQDWTETGRVNEKRLAKRLLTDDRLTVRQRYRIACVYCLRESIPHLWNRLTSGEKQLISGEDDPSCSQEKNRLVLLWSYFMDDRREEEVTQHKSNLWTYAALQAVHYGNQAALMQCWKRLNKHTRKRILIDRALQSLQKWKRIRNKDKWRVNLVSNVYRRFGWRHETIEHFNLPSYYSELVRFFLSKMSKRQQLTFFEIAFENWRSDIDPGCPHFHVLDCFLEWPFQEDFLPTVNRFWGLIPKDLYGQCLISLAINFSGDYSRLSFSASFYTKENLCYDYRSMLWDFWEKTPEEYKQYVFSYKEEERWSSYSKPVIENVLPLLLTRSPLQEKDIALFKRIWHEVPQENRKALMYHKGKRNICLTLVEKRMWSFINWLLEECLPGVEIPSFKVKFAELNGRFMCFIKLEENCEKYVEDFIDWAFESDEEKLQFKYETIKRYGVSHCSDLLSAGEYAELERIINFCVSSEEIPSFKVKVAELNGHLTCFIKLEENCVKYVEGFIDWAFESDEEKLQFKHEMIKQYGASHCSDLLSAGEYAELERIINFCLSSEEMKSQFKENVVKKACHNFLKDCAWEEMDKSISWIFDAEDKISNFKKDLFYSDDFVFQIHLKLVFNQNPLWENVECLYKWFCLSPEEIIELKKKTVFTSRVIDVVHKALCGTMDAFYQKTYGKLDVIVTSLRWCLTDEQMVISFKEEIENHFFEKKGTRYNKRGKKRVGYLVSELFQSFPKEAVHEKTIGEGQFMKDKGEKKSLMVKKDKFNSTRKRFKKAP